MLFNTTFYNSSYTNGFNNKWWRTIYDGRFLVNLATGYEFSFKNNWTIFADLKGSWAGGTRYTPVLAEKSDAAGEIVFDTNRVNSLKVKDYLLVDMRIGYRKNHKRFTDELAIDLQNVSNRRNVLGISYNMKRREYIEALLPGFMPMITYKVYFSI